MDKKTGFVDIELLENEADVMGVAGGAEHTMGCSHTCPTNVTVWGKPITHVCGSCATAKLCAGQIQYYTCVTKSVCNDR